MNWTDHGAKILLLLGLAVIVVTFVIARRNADRQRTSNVERHERLNRSRGNDER